MAQFNDDMAGMQQMHAGQFGYSGQQQQAGQPGVDGNQYGSYAGAGMQQPQAGFAPSEAQPQYNADAELPLDAELVSALQSELHKMQLQENLDKVSLAKQYTPDTSILKDSSNLVKFKVKMPYTWKPNSADMNEPVLCELDPSSLKEQLPDGFDTSKPMLVMEVAKVLTHSTAPYPVEFSLKGIRGKDILSAAATRHTGGSYSTDVLPGSHTDRETLYTANLTEAQWNAWFNNQGSASLEDELAAISEVPTSKTAIVPLHTMVGEKLVAMASTGKLSEHQLKALTNEHGQFVELRATQDLKDQAVAQVKEELAEIVKTNLADVAGEIQRPGYSGEKFGDVDSTGGVSESHKKSFQKMQQDSFVKLEFSVLDPAVFSS